MQRQGEQVVESAVEARAGFLDRPVLAILMISATLAVLAMIASYIGVF